LPKKSSRLILQYYDQEQRAKIDLHKQLSNMLGIRQTALRARVHRVRRKLRECMSECLVRKVGSNDTSLGDI